MKIRQPRSSKRHAEIPDSSHPLGGVEHHRARRAPKRQGRCFGRSAWCLQPRGTRIARTVHRARARGADRVPEPPDGPSRGDLRRAHPRARKNCRRSDRKPQRLPALHARVDRGRRSRGQWSDDGVRLDVGGDPVLPHRPQRDDDLPRRLDAWLPVRHSNDRRGPRHRARHVARSIRRAPVQVPQSSFRRDSTCATRTTSHASSPRRATR